MPCLEEFNTIHSRGGKPIIHKRVFILNVADSINHNCNSPIKFPSINGVSLVKMIEFVGLLPLKTYKIIRKWSIH